MVAAPLTHEKKLAMLTQVVGELASEYPTGDVGLHENGVEAVYGDSVALAALRRAEANLGALNARPVNEKVWAIAVEAYAKVWRGVWRESRPA